MLLIHFNVFMVSYKNKTACCELWNKTEEETCPVCWLTRKYLRHYYMFLETTVYRKVTFKHSLVTVPHDSGMSGSCFVGRILCETGRWCLNFSSKNIFCYNVHYRTGPILYTKPGTKDYIRNLYLQMTTICMVPHLSN